MIAKLVRSERLTHHRILPNFECAKYKQRNQLNEIEREALAKNHVT